MTEVSNRAIAVVGMAGRFPGAPDLESFWENLRSGKESISFFSREELLEAGIDAALVDQPNYVKAAGYLSGADQFDGAYFGFSRSECELLDPQQRVFLEVCQDALNDANCLPRDLNGLIGVFAGVGRSAYLMNHLGCQATNDFAADYAKMISNDSDFLATRVAYKLNLNGPALTVLTACSSALTAVHQACQSLLSFECDAALAGGVSILDYRKMGYLYQKGMIFSADGHCRAFDEASDGTVLGNGAGVVLLKRFDDALRDGDQIDAVILSTAINNDGSEKVGYTAPSVRGQADVIAMAQALAEVGPESISYVEAHGTATPLGDSVEIFALREAFKQAAEREAYCAIGSVKTNLGHLGAAAGIAGLIKTVLALKHREIPPSLHFQRPNPNIDLEGSPFFVNSELQPWTDAIMPRRAGVSSFGIGGTNAHVIMEEAPVPDRDALQSTSETETTILPLSAKSVDSLVAMVAKYSSFLQKGNDQKPGALVDLCFSAANFRNHFPIRAAFVATTGVEMAHKLDKGIQGNFTLHNGQSNGLVFVYSGQGSQWRGMAEELFSRSAVFRETIQACEPIIQQHLGWSVCETLAESRSLEGCGVDRIQPLIVAIQVALTSMWKSWGIHPDAVLGQSMGEISAAYAAGCLSLEDALRVVCVRSRLLASLGGNGAMVLVAMSEKQALDWIDRETLELDIGGVNSEGWIVLSGLEGPIEQAATRLREQEIEVFRVDINSPTHSRHVDRLSRAFPEKLSEISPNSAAIPFYSTAARDGRESDRLDGFYWYRNTRNPVYLQSGLTRLVHDGFRVFVELSPHPMLGAPIQAVLDEVGAKGMVLGSLRKERPERETLLETLGAIYQCGIDVDWSAVYPRSRRKIKVPGYSWDWERYWLESAMRPDDSYEPKHSQGKDFVGGGASENPENPSGLEVTSDAACRGTPIEAIDAMPRDLVDLWRQNLGLVEVDAEAHFFDIGGHSLLAVQLLDQVADRFGVRISMSTFLLEPTLRGIQKRIQTRTPTPDWSPLIPIQRQGWKPGIFFVTPITGLAFPYFDLARLMGKEHPFYALQPRGMRPGGRVHWSIPAMAEYYIRAIQDVQAQGPYHLGGWSFGAPVAFEMARQLRQAGESVGLLALFDTPAIVPSRTKAVLDLTRFFFGTVLQNLMPYVRQFYGILTRPRSDSEVDQSKSFQKRGRGGLLRFVWVSISLARVFAANLIAVCRYRPGEFPGRISLFRTEKTYVEEGADPTWGWAALSKGGVDIRSIPGNHMTFLLPPLVEKIAEELRAALKNHEGSSGV